MLQAPGLSKYKPTTQVGQAKNIYFWPTIFLVLVPTSYLTKLAFWSNVRCFPWDGGVLFSEQLNMPPFSERNLFDVSRKWTSHIANALLQNLPNEPWSFRYLFQTLHTQKPDFLASGDRWWSSCVRLRVIISTLDLLSGQEGPCEGYGGLWDQGA